MLVPRRHKMDAPKVSVIMPVYNTEKYLRQCLESVTAQTLREIEIICVDDGSTDASPAILQEYAARDGRFIILSQQNRFAGVARNAGMVVAKGEYLCFLDSDDVFEPAMLEGALHRAVEDGADVVLWRHENCDEDLNVVNEQPLPSKLVPQSPITPEKAGEVLFTMASPVPWTKLYRHAAVQAHGITFAPTRCANDFTFVNTMFAVAGKISLMQEVYVHYRRFRSNNLSAAREKYFDAYLKAVAGLKENLIRCGVYKQRAAAYRHFAVSSCFVLLNRYTDAEERERKLAEFEREQGKALGDHVRSWSSSGLRRKFYRIRSILRRLRGIG